jgi:hypothetical protein
MTFLILWVFLLVGFLDKAAMGVAEVARLMYFSVEDTLEVAMTMMLGSKNVGLTVSAVVAFKTWVSELPAKAVGARSKL